VSTLRSEQSSTKTMLDRERSAAAIAQVAVRIA
ncbi:unnamed protein product, partial [Cuscuta campestris]